jgi:tetratricopeptide (TPR) repeat protein
MLRFIWAYLVYTWGGLHRYFGNTNNLRSEHETAVRYFTRAYEIDPTFRRVRLERATLLWRELGRPDEALADYDGLLDEDPDYGPALFGRALVLQENGRYQQALNDLDRYLALPEPEPYWDEARRTATLLRELLAE